MTERKIWSREEFMLVMNLYAKIPYGQFNVGNKEVQKLAKILGRTPGAVAYKLVHFAGLDPYHKARGIKGLANPGNNAIKIYNEFRNNWSEMIFESEQLLAKYQNKSLEKEIKKQIEEEKEISLEGKEGTEVKRIVKARVNQNVFRQVIIANYYNSCAICN